MRNKMLIIIGVIVLLFAGLFTAITLKNKQAMDNNENPYGKDKLHQETIDLLDDPLYEDIIVPEDLEDKIAGGDAVTVYFFRPDCVHCQRTTPVLMPLAQDNDVDIVQMNLMEFDETKQYDIEGTPTVVHFDDGEEVARIVGEQTEEDFEDFFNTYVNG